MSAQNFERAFALTLTYEGGYVDDPDDLGGATNLGVTQTTLSLWRGRTVSKAEVRALTRDDVKPIYRKNYWSAVRADELPAGVDLAVYDFAVNSGPSRAIQALQRVLNVADDGRLGPITLAAALAASPTAVADGVCTERLNFLRKIRAGGGWAKYGKGWQRRVENVRLQAKALAGFSPPPAPAPQVASHESILGRWWSKLTTGA
jgi:lysozyme family protein